MPGGSATGGQPQSGRGSFNPGGGMGGGFGNPLANRASQLFGGQPGISALFGGSMGMPGMTPPPNPMTGNTTANPGSPNPANPMAPGGPYGMLGPMLMGGGGNPANANPMMNALSMLLQGKFTPGG